MARHHMIRIAWTALVVLSGLLIVSAPALALEPADKWEGAIDYAATGGSFLEDTCYASLFGCIPGKFDNQGDQMTSISSAVLAGVPENVNIVKAYLVWMGSLESTTLCKDDFGSSDCDGRVKLTPPGGQEYDVVGSEANLEEILYEDVDANDRPATFHYFTFRVDITETMRHHTVTKRKEINGEYSINGFSAYAGEPYRIKGVPVGGWSILLVYANPAGQAKRVYYYTDFQKIHDNMVELRPSGFVVPEAPTAKVTFFIAEGDEGIAGQGPGSSHTESLRFNNRILFDDCNPNNNVYNSTVTTNLTEEEIEAGSCRTNQYSIDLDTFDVSDHLQPDDEDAVVELSLGIDQVLTNYMILSIDTKLPDFDIPGEPEKDADVDADTPVRPGQTFTYRIYIQNNGEDLASNVRVRDQLSPFVTYVADSTSIIDPSGDRRAVADPSTGGVPIVAGFSVVESLPPGPSYRRTVEFDVRLNSEAQGVTKDTLVENVGEIISGQGDIYFTNGGIPTRHSVTLESYEGSLDFSEGAGHPSSRFVTAGQSKVIIAQLDLTASEGDVQLFSMRFTPMEGVDPTVITGAELFLDVNQDGNIDLDGGDQQLGSRAGWQSGGLSFTTLGPLNLISKDAVHRVILTADVSASAQAGSVCQLELKSDNVNMTGFSSGLPFRTATIYMPSADTSLTFELGPHNPGSGNIPADSTVVAMQLRLNAYAPSVSVTSIRFRADGSVYDPSEITQVSFHLDADSDGTIGLLDSSLGQGIFSEDNGWIEFSGLDLNVVMGVPLDLLVSVSLAAGIDEGSMFRLLIESNSDVTASGIVYGAPVAGTFFTIQENAFCQTDEECQTRFGSDWHCNPVNHSCASGSIADGDADGDQITDGDADGDGEGTDGDGVTDDKKGGGGCSLPDHAGLTPLLLAALWMALRAVRRKRGWSSAR